MTANSSMMIIVLLGVVAFVAAIAPSDVAQETDNLPCPACELARNEHCFTENDRDSCEPGYHRNYDGKCNNEEDPDTRPCCPCEPNSYQPRYNDCKCCVVCTNCSKNGTEEVRPCSATQDAMCGEKLSPTTTQEETPSATTTVETATVMTTTEGSLIVTDVPPHNVNCTDIPHESKFLWMLGGIAGGCLLTTIFWIWQYEWARQLYVRIPS